MHNICSRCGAPRRRKIATIKEFEAWGYDVEKDFPFRQRFDIIIGLCEKCRKEITGRHQGIFRYRGEVWRTGEGMPQYTPLDGSAKNV